MILPIRVKGNNAQSADSLSLCVRACVRACKLTSSAPAHEAQVVEAGHLVLHHGRRVPQLGRVVLVVPGHHRDQGPVGHVPESHHLHHTRWESYPGGGGHTRTRARARGRTQNRISLNIRGGRRVYATGLK